MKKALMLSLTMLLGLMFIAAPMVEAGSKCCLGKTAACVSHGSAETGKATDDICANYQGKCENVTLAIKGMTCVGCENSIKTALEAEEGVIKVCSIDYNTGQALVCFDPDKVKADKLTETVIKKGYKAEIAPMAEGTVKAEIKTAAKSGCSPTCILSGKSCAGQKTASTDDTKTEKSKTE